MPVHGYHHIIQRYLQILLHASFIKDVLSYMKEHDDFIPDSLALIQISKGIERIGDYVTNIMEEVHFLIEGKYNNS